MNWGWGFNRQIPVCVLHEIRKVRHDKLEKGGERISHTEQKILFAFFSNFALKRKKKKKVAFSSETEKL